MAGMSLWRHGMMEAQKVNLFPAYDVCCYTRGLQSARAHVCPEAEAGANKWHGQMLSPVMLYVHTALSSGPTQNTSQRPSHFHTKEAFEANEQLEGKP